MGDLWQEDNTLMIFNTTGDEGGTIIKQLFKTNYDLLLDHSRFRSN